MARLAQRHWLSVLEKEARFGSINVMIVGESCGLHNIAAQLHLTVFEHEFSGRQRTDIDTGERMIKFTPCAQGS